MPPVITKEKCSGCGICADVCPLDVFSKEKQDKVPLVGHGEECWHCNSCVLDCPTGAVSLRIPLPQMMLYVDAIKEEERN